MIQASCPICQRELRGESPAQFPQYPFCSQRCKRIDLGRWLGETYRLSVEKSEEEDARFEDKDIP